MTAAKNTQLLTNPKAGKADPKEVDRIIRAVRAMENPDVRDLPMKGLVSSQTKYSRAWQIAAWECVNHHYPTLFLPAEVRASKDQTGQAIVAMRDQKRFSWGLIGVLCTMPESEARSEYKKNSGKLDRGQRIGHGGRFLADDATLYDAAERHSNGVVFKSTVEADKAMGKVRDAAHAKDIKTFGQYVVNSTLAPKPVRKPRTAKAKKVQEEVAA